jgi:GntR family transcriptional regulator, transcriptional repressor for pyruvate dehydrogenase complex
VARNDGTKGFVARPITTVGAAEQIAGHLREAISAGQLPPGTRLPSEVDLASEYGVSRGTIRETFKLLASRGLVSSTRGAAGGTFVRLPEPDRVAAAVGETIALWFNAGETSVAELTDARAWIDRGCVKLAAHQATPGDLEAVRVTVEAMEAPGIVMDEMLALDIDFHAAISHAAHNAILDLAMNAILLVRPYTNTMLLPLLDIGVIAAQHRAIYEAVRSGSEEAGEAALDVHLAHLDEVRQRALADLRPEDVAVGALTDEAHPAVERIRDRLLARDLAGGPG